MTRPTGRVRRFPIFSQGESGRVVSHPTVGFPLFGLTHVFGDVSGTVFGAVSSIVSGRVCANVFMVLV